MGRFGGAEHPNPRRVWAAGEEGRLSGSTEARMAKTLNSNLRRLTFMYGQFREVIFSRKN